jgi:polyribonucleotide nucleotidyltransferase
MMLSTDNLIYPLNRIKITVNSIMHKKKRTLEDDLALLEYLQQHEVKEASVQFKTSEAAIRAWLSRLRKRIVRLQIFLNRVRTMQRISPRIRKLSSIGGVPPEEEEDKY